MSEKLIEKLRQRNWSMTIHEVQQSCLAGLRSQGLFAVVFCNDGTGRSRNVAQTLTESHQIPAVCIQGGLSQLNSDEHLLDRPYITDILNSLPVLGIILTQQEMLLYRGILNQLKASRYQRTPDAIESIVNIHSRMRSV